MEPKFVTGHPAVLLGRTLVIADIHIGAEFTFFKSGIKIPSNTKEILAEIQNLARSTRAKKLIIIGDAKHKVPGVTWQELREIPDFLDSLAREIKVEVVKGNHDAGIEELVPENVKLHGSQGFASEGCYLLHGHTWPKPEFMESRYVFVGHEHPQIEFRDALGYRFSMPVWLRAELDRKKLEKKYKYVPSVLPELIIMPAFNKLSGGIRMNSTISEIGRQHTGERGGIGTLVRSAKLKTSKVYMIDGTFLGRLGDLF